MRISRSRGFTLVEVMVALVVMSVGVGGLLAALSQSTDHVAFARDHDHAVRLARRTLHYLRHAEVMEERRETGEDGRFVWTAQAQEVEDEFLQVPESERGGSRLALMKLSVGVQWRDVEDGPLGHNVTLVTYRAMSTRKEAENVFPLQSP